MPRAGSSADSDSDEEDETGASGHRPAHEYIEEMFAEMDKPLLANNKMQPKGQWAMLRYMGQRKALEESKQAAMNDRKSGEPMAKLAALPRAR